MAIFHLSFKILKRSEGKSSLYLAAYNSRTRLKDERTGLIFNYEKKKEDLMHSDILLPPNAPESFKNRSVLFNAVESIEARRDSQLVRYFIVALPRELTLTQNKELITNYINKNFIKKGMCADLAIHNDKDNNNPHAHVMLTMREVNKYGFLPTKNRNWNDKKNVEIWRRSWAVSVNKFLRENNKDELVSSLSFLKQKELLIQKATDSLNSNKINEAEKYISAYEQIKNKKPKKRKHRKSYFTRKKLKFDIEIYKQKEVTKKENLLNTFFKNILNKITEKSRIKKEMEERKKREIAANEQWQKNENERSKAKEERQRIKDNLIKNVKNEDLKNDSKQQSKYRKEDRKFRI